MIIAVRRKAHSWGRLLEQPGKVEAHSVEVH